MFLLFAGNDYYPKGGALDLIGRYSDIEEAMAAHNPQAFTYDGGWANILDQSSMAIVKVFYGSEWRDYVKDET